MDTVNNELQLIPPSVGNQGGVTEWIHLAPPNDAIAQATMKTVFDCHSSHVDVRFADKKHHASILGEDHYLYSSMPIYSIGQWISMFPLVLSLLFIIK